MNSRSFFGHARRVVAAFGASLWFLVAVAGVGRADAAIQFDLFLGYDGIVPEASWVPLVCEIKNDAGSFVGTIEILPGMMNAGVSRRTVVELPTGTLKRIVLPVFSPSRNFTSWDVRLLDERGKVRAEQLGLQPRRLVAAFAPMLGALPRAASGNPEIRSVLLDRSEWQPQVARFQAQIFPDNPLVLEGLRSLYLNSERALELEVPQARAIQAWVHAGGRLIVAVEQIADVNSTPWLKDLVGAELVEFQKVARHAELMDWLTQEDWAPSPVELSAGQAPQPQVYYPGVGKKKKQKTAPVVSSPSGRPFADLQPDADFESAELQVASARFNPERTRVLVSSEYMPLIVETPRGMGQVTLLLFSPEREPFRSWEHLPIFWAKLAQVPGSCYLGSDFSNAGGWASDAILAAMLETRQVNKLPVSWLLLLLVVYLVVIGPLDQYWLKKLGKPMLTWITFPSYVILFSLLIYYIGYRLRAGESEWNELHFVDVVASRDTVQTPLRGRTFASVYSPANQRYLLAGAQSQSYATLRPEFAGAFGGNQAGDGSVILQQGDSYRADVQVAVWTSLLLASDWWASGTAPLAVSLATGEDGVRVTVTNRTARRFPAAKVAYVNQIYDLGDIDAQASKSVLLDDQPHQLLSDFASMHGGLFQQAVQARQYAFRGGDSGRIDDVYNASAVVSFLSAIPQPQNFYNRFISPPGVDLTPTLREGAAVLLAWDSDNAPVPPVRQFTPKISKRNTLWRILVRP